MDIAIRIEGRHDLTGQIFRQLRTAIVDGRLAGGARLPSTRDLAKQLGVSRKTTLDAFERLVAEGYLNTRAGDGTFVADGLARVPHAAAMSAPSSSNTRRASTRSTRVHCGTTCPTRSRCPRRRTHRASTFAAA